MGCQKTSITASAKFIEKTITERIPLEETLEMIKLLQREVKLYFYRSEFSKENHLTGNKFSSRCEKSSQNLGCQKTSISSAAKSIQNTIYKEIPIQLMLEIINLMKREGKLDSL